MKTSESIKQIAGALLEAQKAITFAVKDAKNPFFKTMYADLPTVIDAVKPALNDAGISFVQSASPSESGTLALTTRLLHVSGEWIEDTAITPLVKNDPQSYGSAITYLRRYSLAAMTGLYQDDDDGHSATMTAPKPDRFTDKPAAKKSYLTSDDIARIGDALDSAGLSVDDVCKVAKVNELEEIESSRLDGLLKWISNNKKETA
jgi:hypothetical protein